MLRPILTLVLMAATLPSFAQETATKVSDFNYGTRGESVIIAPHAANGILYGSFRQFYGNDNAGLLSILDPQTGVATAVLDPEQTNWYSGQPSDIVPNVFAAGGMTFGLQRDLATGNNLYRIEDGTATLLLSAPLLAFSEMVAFNDSLYFLVGTIPLSASAIGGRDELVLELWRTDGTPEGTQQVATLLSFFDERHTRLVAGTSKLLLSIQNGSDQVFYTYEPATQTTALVAQNFNQFILQNSRFDRQFAPVAYQNGQFYAFGKEDISGTSGLYRIGEESGDIIIMDYPGPRGNDRNYDEVNFFHFQDRLYFQTGDSRSVEGNDLFRLSPTGTAIETIFFTADNPDFGFRTDNLQPAMDGDSLYFLSRVTTDSLTLFVYSERLDTPQVRFSFLAEDDGFFGNPIWTEITDEYLYLADEGNSNLYRLDRTTGEADSLSLRFHVTDFNSLVSPITLFDDDLFFVVDSEQSLAGPGLYRWSSAAAAPVKIGDYLTFFNRRNPIIRGYDASDNHLLLTVGALMSVDLETEEVEPVLLPDTLMINRGFLEGSLAGDLYYVLSSNSEEFQLFAKYQDNSFELVPMVFEEETLLGTNYALSNTNLIGENTLIGRLRLLETNELYPVIGTLEDGTMRLRSLSPESRNATPGFTSQGFISMVYYDNTADTVVVALFDTLGVQLRQTTIPADVSPLRVSEEGVFAEFVVTEDFSFEKQIIYFPFDVTASPETLRFERATIALNAPNFYLLGNRFVFVADSPVTGREWYVATPGTGQITPLVDINPGPAFGTNFTTATLLGKDHLFFIANDGIAGAEPWITDGTTENTRMLADINPGEGSSNPTDVYLRDSVAYFAANGPAGYEVYRMSLRSLQPELIIDLNPGPGDSHPYNFTLVGDDFYFLGREAPGTTNELYRIAYELVPTEAEPTLRPAKLYPNPVGQLPLTVEAPSGEQLQRIEVFQPNGQLLLEKAAKGERTQLNLSHLPGGQYWVRTWYASGRFSINGLSRVR